MRGSRSVVGLSSILVLLAGCGSSHASGASESSSGFGTPSGSGSQSSGGGSVTSTGNATGSGVGSVAASGGGSGTADGTLVIGISGGGITSSGNTSSSTAGAGDGGLCGATHVTATSNTSVLLVVDRSYSMTERPTGFSTNKWAALVQALPAAMMTVQDQVAFGLELFPTPSAGAGNTGGLGGGMGGGLGGGFGGGGSCTVASGAAGIQVPIGPGTMTVPQIDTVLQDPANDPAAQIGFTPTADALQTALTYFTSGAGASVTGEKYVILATDGGPNCNSELTCDADHCTMNLDNNCRMGAVGGGIGGGPGAMATTGTIGGMTTTGATGGMTTTGATGGMATTNCCATSPTSCLDDARTTAALQALAQAGIKTFVVGIPGTEAYASILDGFAQAGQEVNPSGPPSYFAVSASAGVQGFESVLQSIARTLIKTCQFQLVQLSSTPQAGYRLAVYVDDNLATEGTDYTLDTSTSPPTVVLEGSTCDSVLAKGAESVDIEVFCPGVMPPPHIHVN